MEEPRKRKTVAIIPSRYASSRLPGKGLADINGKPMIWWVYNQCLKSKRLDDVVAAIDDERLEEACVKHGIKYIMTSKNCKGYIQRIWEASETVYADVYVAVCGDEPMIEPEAIDTVCWYVTFERSNRGFLKGYTDLTNPIAAYDFASIKLVTDVYGDVLLMTRSPIPYPKGSRDFTLKKSVGVNAFSKRSLDFLIEHPEPGPLERIEEIDELRYIEYGHRVRAVRVQSSSVSVDTPKDLEFVRKALA